MAVRPTQPGWGGRPTRFRGRPGRHEGRGVAVINGAVGSSRVAGRWPELRWGALMSIGQASSYDELPYSDNCFPDTHPDYLATLGRLYGIDTPEVSTCRVLELGCAGGANLIPMGLELPEARFVGIDLSNRQIDAGRSIVDRLGLRNVELLALSIEEVDERFGSFDYIICHGVYSWVPEPIRDKILEVCSTRLNPDGIAYLSYNTYPGWHARGMVREMMAFHVRGTTSAIDRVEKARELLENVVRVLPDPSSSYARILRTEGEFLRGVANSYLYHEHLEETNHPVYFRELVALATAKGLQYLAEARTPGLLDNLPAEARELVESWSEDRLAAEQYLDFLCNRTFRRSLLCKADRERLDVPSPEVVSSCWVNSNVVPVSADPDVASDAAEEFRRPDGAAGLTTNNPQIKAALVAIHEGRHEPLAFVDPPKARIEARLERHPRRRRRPSPRTVPAPLLPLEPDRTSRQPPAIPGRPLRVPPRQPPGQAPGRGERTGHEPPPEDRRAGRVRMPGDPPARRSA